MASDPSSGIGGVMAATGSASISRATGKAAPTQAGKAPPAGPDSLRAAIKSLRGSFVGVGAFSAVSNLLMLTGPLFMLEIYDRVLPSGSVPTLIVLSAVVIALFAGQAVIDAIRGRVLSRMGSALELQLGPPVYRTLLRLSLRRGVTDAMAPVRDLGAVRSFLSGLGPTVLFDLPWIPIYIGIVYAFHPVLGLTALAGAIVLVAVSVVAEWLIRKPAREGQKRDEERLAFGEASSRNAEVLISMGLSARMSERWQRASESQIDAHQQTNDLAGGFGSVSKALRMILQSTILGVGAYLVIGQDASAGVIIAASILTARALAPVDLAIGHWKGFIAAREGWRRLRELMTALPAETQRIALPAPQANLTVQAVSITPPGGNRLTVQNVSFTLEAGQALGVVGTSASGKSTLARVLVGLWPAVRGHIRLDGTELEHWPEEDRGGHIGYLPQTVELFSGTVAQNIARFDPEASDDAILAAARAAGVHEMIASLNDGYQTEVGERGAALSAGQQQRIALARALYGDPFLVVLDEPNSNLDAEGEAALTRAIVGVRRRKGVVVVIAHRPSALIATDTVLVLRQGRMEKFGPKDEVLRSVLRPSSVSPRATQPAKRAALDKQHDGDRNESHK